MYWERAFSPVDRNRAFYRLAARKLRGLALLRAQRCGALSARGNDCKSSGSKP